MESLEINSNDKNSNNTNEDKINISDIICTYPVSYFPQPQIGKVCKRYINTIDYMVGMNEFDDVLKRLSIDNNYLNRENKIYNVLEVDVLQKIGSITNDEITSIGGYTNRVESSLYTTIGFDVYVMKHLQQYYINDMLIDIGNSVIHRFIQLNYKRSNLIIHLFPYKCMVEKNISYSDALSYCISIMWATLINIVKKKAVKAKIIDLLKEVFYSLNPILTKIVICTNRELTSDGYSLIQEMSQLTSADKFIDIKTLPNRVVIRWSPRSDRFENYIYKCFRKETDKWEDEPLQDLRGDSNGKRCLIYDGSIVKNNLITQITIVGQNIIRDITGYYTTSIYGLLCDEEILEDYELSSLFRILTGTKEYNIPFRQEVMNTYMNVRGQRIKFLTDDSNHSFPIKLPKKKSKHLKSLPQVLNTTEKAYTPNMISFAVEKVNKRVFLDMEINNDYYIANQLVEKFHLKRNIPKDIMTVLKMSDLSQKELEAKLVIIERHKRSKIRGMIEFARTLARPKPVLHRMFNYLWQERYV